jgi:predicted GNAT family N-acyltransferase
MNIQFINVTDSPEQFFNILPQDWQALIVPYWDSYKDSAKIYVLKENDEVVTGGLVFSKSLPDMSDFERSVQYLFSEGYLYIGFIWVPEHKRNQQLASQWLTLLKKQNPNQKYWLTIEEAWLKHFYEKNGFKLIKESNDADNKEWLYTYA